MKSSQDSRYDSGPSEPVDDLVLRNNEPEYYRERVSSSVRDIASRIPESLSSIGRDISRTIERAISAKDDYVVAVKVSHEAQERLEQIVQAGGVPKRPGAAALLHVQGTHGQAPPL